MNGSFDALPWHDAVLLWICIDRRNAGERDEVRFRVRWPHGDEVLLLFRDCYAMTAEMNFGVIAEEAIASAELIESDPALASIRERWKSIGVSLEELRCYAIRMASTSSVIKIYAKQFEMDG